MSESKKNDKVLQKRKRKEVCYADPLTEEEEEEEVDVEGE